MEIVVNHLTRMRTKARICVAGVDAAELRHVRPVTPATDLLTRRLLGEQRGPLSVGAVVDIGNPTPVSSPPETEDHRIASRDLVFVRRLDDDDYLNVLAEVAEPDLEAAFGEDLERRGWKYAIDEGRGRSSLAVVQAQRRADIDGDRYGKLRLRFNDPEKPTYLSVADVRFVEADHQTLRTAVIEDVRRRLHRGVGLFVMFGLSRAFMAAGDDRDRHWLQVNGVCLEDRPVGDAP